MTMSVIILFLFSTSIYLVKSNPECYRNHASTLTDDLCQEWWTYAVGPRGSENDKKGCIKMIREKCPGIDLEMSTTIRRGYFVHDFTYETWTYTTQATRKSDGSSSAYFKYEKHPICWDDDGKVSDCDYWWKVAKDPNAKDKYKERCIERILNHCSGRLSLVGVTNGECLQNCLKGYQVKTFTYKDENDIRVSYEKQVSVV